MRAIMESGFYILYLVFIVGLGIYLCTKEKNNKSLILFGIACIVLGLGDAFHLIPRAVGLFSKTLDNPSETLAKWLGVGKLITSITMTFFYLLLYFALKKSGKSLKYERYLDICIYVLVLTRLVLCFMPQNEWLTNSSPFLWGIIRNIPFVILGIIMIVLTNIYLKDAKQFKLLWLAITLSFLFYIPVVLWAGTYAWVGMLMLPKTICYMWIGFMGYRTYKANK